MFYDQSTTYQAPQYKPAQHAIMDNLTPRPEHSMLPSSGNSAVANAQCACCNMQPLQGCAMAATAGSPPMLQDSQTSSLPPQAESQTSSEPARTPLGWVDDFIKKAKDAPAAVPKKTAAKIIKAFEVHAHGNLFYKTTPNKYRTPPIIPNTQVLIPFTWANWSHICFPMCSYVFICVPYVFLMCSYVYVFICLSTITYVFLSVFILVPQYMNDFTLQAKLAIEDKKANKVKKVKKPLTNVKKPLTKVNKPLTKTRAPTPPLALDMRMLQYKQAHKLPRHYGSVTIYTSLADSLWRVKPAPGRRDEMKFKFNTNPRVQWAALVKHVKSLPQES